MGLSNSNAVCVCGSPARNRVLLHLTLQKCNCCTVYLTMLLLNTLARSCRLANVKGETNWLQFKGDTHRSLRRADDQVVM